MDGSDPKSSELHDLAREVAKSAASSNAAYGQTQPLSRQVVMTSPQANTGQGQSSHYWSVTWLSAAAIIIALAIIAAAGWIL